MPEFISSNPQCPIVTSLYTVTASDPGTAIAEPTFTSTGAILKAGPLRDNLNIVKQYDFFIRAEAEVKAGLTPLNQLYTS
jgi:hypothetical protein